MSVKDGKFVSKPLSGGVEFDLQGQSQATGCKYVSKPLSGGVEFDLLGTIAWTPDHTGFKAAKRRGRIRPRIERKLKEIEQRFQSR